MPFQIIYTSISTHPRGHVSDLDILKIAQSVNKDLNVTGFLLRAPNHFVQILEGDPNNVNLIMSRIRKDPNHTSTDEISHRRPTPRAFQNWPMGYADMSAKEDSALTNTLLTMNQNWNRALTTIHEIANTFSKEYTR